jgi:hypothetical protein
MWAWTTRASRLAPLLIGVLLIGFAFGRFSAGGRAVDAAAPAGSPVAVACTPVATSTPEPSPTPTPSPTVVPPAAVGQSLTYAGEWTVVVMDVALTSTFSDLTPEAGVFAKVSLTMTNNTGDRMRFPYDDLVLLDGNGSTFFPSRGSKLVPG